MLLKTDLINKLHLNKFNPKIHVFCDTRSVMESEIIHHNMSILLKVYMTEIFFLRFLAL